ncbi:MAG: class I SAM-dependent methyltransferase [Pseudomonadota bacterium]
MNYSANRFAAYRRQSRQVARLLAAKIVNLFGSGRSGFFIPYRYANSLSTPYYTVVDERFRAASAGFLEILKWMTEFRHQLLGLAGPAPTPRWQQDWFTGLDGAAAYTIIRKIRPRRIVEIGSGHSTRFMAQARDDGALTCTHKCIDPSPRATLTGLNVDWTQELFGSRHFDFIRELEPNDVLFIDSSHVGMPGTDVDLIFADVLGFLPRGVWVHVHDIFLPDPYPKHWTWRGYNEQSLVAMLVAMRSVTPVFASHYARTRLAEALNVHVVNELPIPAGVPETSLWFTIAD